MIFLQVTFFLIIIIVSCKNAEPPAMVKSSDKKITSLPTVIDVSNTIVSYDSSTFTYSVTVPIGTDLTNLSFIINISENATISPNPSISRDYSNPVQFSVKAQDDSIQTYIIKVAIEQNLKSSEKLIVEFRFDRLTPIVNGAIDYPKNKIVLTTPSGTDRSALIPTILISQKATINPLSGIAQDFTDPVSYVVTAEDGSTSQYEVSVENATDPSLDQSETVFFGGEDYKFYALNAITGEKRWDFMTNYVIINSSPAIDNGLVYFGAYDGRVYAFDALSGIQKWNFPAGYQVESTPYVLNGTLYVGSNFGKVYALDSDKGTKKWEFKTDGYVTSSPTVWNNTLYIGSNDKKLYALDASTGAKKWEYLTGGSVYSSPAVVNGIVYFTSGDKQFYAVDAVTGQKKWQFQNNGAETSPTIHDGIVYIGGDKLYAINAATGIEVWSFKTGESFASSPIVYNNHVYAVNWDDLLYAINAETGVKKWSFKTNLGSDPCIANGILYIGGNLNGSGILYAMDADAGYIKWSFKIGGSSLYGSPAVLLKNGKGVYSAVSGSQN